LVEHPQLSGPQRIGWVVDVAVAGVEEVVEHDHEFGGFPVAGGLAGADDTAGAGGEQAGGQGERLVVIDIREIAHASAKNGKESGRS
jgi:hypothetical protein